MSSAHPAITPLDFRRTADDLRNEGWPDEHVQMYRLMREMGLASFAPELVVNERRHLFRIGDETFAVCWTEIVNRGWTAVHPRAELPKPAVPNTIGSLRLEWEPDRLLDIDVIRDEAPPLDYAVLVEQMRDGGFGRPSTYASTIAKLLEKNWIERGDGIELCITDEGRRVAELLEAKDAPEPRLTPEFSAEFEHVLSEIEAFRCRPTEALAYIASLVGEDVIADLSWLDRIGESFEGETAQQWHAARDAETPPPPPTVSSVPEPERNLESNHALRDARSQLHDRLGRAYGKEWRRMSSDQRSRYMSGALRAATRMDETLLRQRFEFDGLVRWAAMIQNGAIVDETLFQEWFSAFELEHQEAIMLAASDLAVAIGL